MSQCNDTISGTDINPSIDDVFLRFHQIKETTSNLLNKQLQAISENINTLGDGLPGYLPAKHSFIEISHDNLVVTVLKKAEDSDDLIMRFYETKGIGCTAKIRLSPLMGIDAVNKTDLLENDIEDIPMNKHAFEVKVGKFSIESYKLIKDYY